jgi:hypothetical protein
MGYFNLELISILKGDLGFGRPTYAGGSAGK